MKNDHTQKDVAVNKSQKEFTLLTPFDLRHQAKGWGLTCEEGGRGSDVYIDLERDKSTMQNLQHMLPTAYRNETEAFEFPPIRHQAAKHNLWRSSIQTADYIRSVNYAKMATAAICGKSRWPIN